MGNMATWYFADFELWKEFHLKKIGIFSLRRLPANKGDIDAKSGPSLSIFMIGKVNKMATFLLIFWGAWASSNKFIVENIWVVMTFFYLSFHSFDEEAFLPTIWFFQHCKRPVGIISLQYCAPLLNWCWGPQMQYIWKKFQELGKVHYGKKMPILSSSVVPSN